MAKRFGAIGSEKHKSPPKTKKRRAAKQAMLAAKAARKTW